MPKHVFKNSCPFSSIFWSLIRRFVESSKVSDAWKVTLFACFHRLRNLLVLNFWLYLEATSYLICFFLNRCKRGYSVQRTLIQISSTSFPGTFPWKSPWERGWNKLILRCYHAAGWSAGMGLRNTVKFSPDRRETKQSKNNGDREQASNSERTEVKWRFSKLLSDGSQISLKTSEITSTSFTIWNDCIYVLFLELGY